MTLNKKYLLTLGTILIVVGIVLAFYFFVDIDFIVSVIKTANYKMMFIASIFFIIGITINTLRWIRLLPSKANAMKIAHSNHLGYLINVVTPIPGSISRVYTTRQSANISGSRTTASMIVERALSQVMRVVVITIVAVLGLQKAADELSLVKVLPVTIALFVLIFWIQAHPQSLLKMTNALTHRFKRLPKKRILKSTHAMIKGFESVGNTKEFASILIVTIIMWIFFFLFYALTLQSLNLGFPIMGVVMISLVTLAVEPPNSPSMPGTFQASIVGPLLILALADLNTAMVYAIVLNVIQLLLWLLLGTWAVISLKRSGMNFSDFIVSLKSIDEVDRISE